MQVQNIAKPCTLVFVTLFKVLVYKDIVSSVVIELILKFEDWMPHGEIFFQYEEMASVINFVLYGLCLDYSLVI